MMGNVEVRSVNAKEAVAKRISELCAEQDLAVNALANSAGIVTIKQICDGMDISLRQFFDSPIFDRLEKEIR